MNDNAQANDDDSDEPSYERVYRKREMDTKIEYIKNTLDKMHQLAKDNLKEARKTNGRVTTLEEKVGDLEEVSEQVEENKEQITFWRGATYIIGAVMIPVLVKVILNAVM